jgi:hypothetical protein
MARFCWADLLQFVREKACTDEMACPKAFDYFPIFLSMLFRYLAAETLRDELGQKLGLVAAAK